MSHDPLKGRPTAAEGPTAVSNQPSRSADPERGATPEDAADARVDAAAPVKQILPAASQPGLVLRETATRIDLAAALPSPRQAEIAGLAALATARFDAEDYAGAADSLVQILKLIPDSAVAHGNLAAALWRMKRVARAEVLFRRALALDPDYVPAQRLLAEVLRERGDVDGALAAYERLLQLDPGDVVSLNNAGLMLRAAERFAEAEATFARALALQSGDPCIRFNQIASRRDDAHIEEAIECCRRVLAQAPDSAETLTNLGVSLHFAGQFAEALACLERAVARDPANHQAHFNFATLLLLHGDYARGWREYDHRWGVAHMKKAEYRQPEWDGKDLAGKTILLHSDQGFGDAIQFLRYVPAVAARSGRVLVRIERALARIAASLPGNPLILPMDAAIPPFDLWCNLGSLPRILGTLAHTIPADIPYLRPRAALAERWRGRLAGLAGLAGLKVGLVWAGNPKHSNDYRRSMPFGPLAPILATPGASFVSLQVPSRAADLAAAPPDAILDLAPELRDFAETAGVIANLDLVIAVDTAVAHLAGAIGKPVWVMLPLCPDWRWLLAHDEDSPWYPTMRLYRQQTPGDWAGVVARVAADLGAMAAARAGATDVPVAAVLSSAP
jgi:tetratricopeptide (TPR) repeat protein